MAATVFDPLVSAVASLYGVVGPNLWNLILYTIGMAVYAIFIWHFSRYIAQRDVFKWDAEKWARSGGLGRFAEGFGYLIKYLIFYPILVFIWFGVFSTFMFLLGKSLQIDQILLVSFALVTSIRIMAYYSEDLSRQVSILLPLAMLGIFVIQPTFFNFDAASNRIFDLVSFVGDIFKFLAFSISVEWFLRIVWDIKQRVAPHIHAPGNIVERFGR